MFGGDGDITQTQRYEIPPELRPYVTRAISALTGAISLYPITPLFQMHVRPIVAQTPLQQLLAAQLMTLPFGGIAPYIQNIPGLFPVLPPLDLTGAQEFPQFPVGMENVIARLEELRSELERLREQMSPWYHSEYYYFGPG